MHNWLKSSIFWLALALCGAVFIALSVGSQTINLWTVLSSHNSTLYAIVMDIRLPRIINAITVGALLSIAGLMIQNLVKNPLADPYILGISGASASVQLALISSGIVLPFWLFGIIGFFAAMASLLLLLLITARKTRSSATLLLTGVVMAFAYGAIISLLLTISPASSTKPMLFWLMGDLSHANLSYFPILFLLAGSLWAFAYHKELDILARGEFFAQKTGVDTKKINLLILFTAAIFTAIAVSIAGTIGFIGLVVPHLARLLVGNNHARLIPLAAVIGALLLLIADTLARTVLSPIQLPVGVFTALFGVPVFIYLLGKNA